MNITFSGWSGGDPWEGNCWSSPLAGGIEAGQETLQKALATEAWERGLLEEWASQDAISDIGRATLARGSGVDVWLIKQRWPKHTDKPVLQVAVYELEDR